MPSPRVLCLGEMLFDRLAEQTGPAEAVTSWNDYPGGAPANVACALAKLGVPVGFVGSLGTDSAGDALLAVLQGAGVNTEGVQRHAEMPTRTVEVLRNHQGDRQFAGFGGGVADGFADAQLQAGALPVPLFEQAEYLVLGSIPLAYEASAQAVARALDLANSYYLKIFMDVNWRPSFWPEPAGAKDKILDLLAQADFLKLSQEEAEFLFETVDPLDILRQQEQLEGIFVTSGSQGCAYAFTQGLVGRLPGFVTAVQDTTGAGDSFVAALVHQLLHHGLRALSSAPTVEAMVRYASAAGALTTMKPGAIAAQPTDAEIQSFLVGRVS